MPDTNREHANCVTPIQPAVVNQLAFRMSVNIHIWQVGKVHLAPLGWWSIELYGMLRQVGRTPSTNAAIQFASFEGKELKQDLPWPKAKPHVLASPISTTDLIN